MLPTIMSLKDYGQIADILVVGCGGTGGHLVPNLARLIYVMNADSLRNNRHASTINLFLADGDTVEVNNLVRQHFITSDIGRNKAEVLGERYAAAFGLEIGVIPKYLEKVEDFNFFDKKVGIKEKSWLVIGCVDNNASRKVIYEWFSRENCYASSFWIDSGNEEKSGQVVCGHRPGAYGGFGRMKLNPYMKGLLQRKAEGDFSLPCAVEVYPELLHLNDKFSSQISCAERSQAAPQNMQTNVTAATIIMNFVQKLLSVNGGLKSHCVEFNINNAFSTRLNTVKNLRCVETKRRAPWEVDNNVY